MNGRRDHAEGHAPSAAPAVTAAAIGAAVVTLGVSHGGYAPAAWGWSALLALWITMLVLVLRSALAVERSEVAYVGLVVALAGWTALTVTWTLSVPRTVLEVERDLVYVACAAAVVLGARVVGRQAIIVGLASGLVVLVAFALFSYLVAPLTFDATQGYLLFRPLGYANAVGGICALALPPVLAFGAHDARAAVRSAVGASAVVLFVALFLTQNRSAWLALGCAMIVWALRTGSPVRTVGRAAVLCAPALFAVALAWCLDPLDSAAQPAAIHERRLVVGAAVVTFAGTGAALGRRLRAPRLSRTTVLRSAWAGSLFVVAAAAVAFTRPGIRAHYWRAAWHAFRHQPLVGSGAGTFDLEWFRYRDVAATVRDAHNLYLGTLSELGLVGLVLLLAVLALPIVSARRTRDPLLTAVLGAYCGFLVHVAFEWDWKFPVVTGSGLVLGSVLAGADPGGRLVRIERAARVAGVAAAAIAAAFAVASLAGNSYVVSAEARMTAGDPAAAAARASRARKLVPWASEPWVVIADSDARAGDLVDARAALHQALGRDRYDWTLWVRLAEVAHGEERARALRRALELNPLLAAG
ncbi:MAG: O-antigen ligase family protein [Gaiellaceae bacterium]